jgi:hypothetical protein
LRDFFIKSGFRKEIVSECSLADESDFSKCERDAEMLMIVEVCKSEGLKIRYYSGFSKKPSQSSSNQV